MRIHLFQHVPFEGPGRIAPVLAALGHELRVTRADRGEPWPTVGDGEGLVVMGGPMNVDEEDRFPWLAAEKQALRAAVRDGRPVLGICLGAQLVARALGARVYPSGTKEIGWFPVAMHEEARASGFFPRAGEGATVFHWHGDTFDLPPGARLLASSDACRNQAFLVGERVLGLQFHLEVGPDEVEAMLAHCAAELSPSGATVQDAATMRRETERHDTEPLLGDALTRLFGAERR